MTNVLEDFADCHLPIFALGKREVEEMFGIKLEYFKIRERIPVRIYSDEANIYLPKEELADRPRKFKDCNIAIDRREADIILDKKRKDLLADAVVSVNYSGPYCRKKNDMTVFAEGYPVKIIP